MGFNYYQSVSWHSWWMMITCCFFPWPTKRTIPLDNWLETNRCQSNEFFNEHKHTKFFDAYFNLLKIESILFRPSSSSINRILNKIICFIYLSLSRN